MFAFLASVHRVAPQLEESTEEQENSEQMREGPLTVKYVKLRDQSAQVKKIKRRNENPNFYKAKMKLF